MKNGQTVYIVVNEGNILYATKELDEAKGFCNDKIDEGVLEAAEECGRDLDDMTDEEIGEMSFMSGFNGGYHYVSKAEINDDMDDSETVTAEGVDNCEEDNFEVGDIREALKSSEEMDSYFDDFDFEEENKEENEDILDFGELDSED